MGLNLKSTSRWWSLREWGFSLHERRAVWLLTFLLLLGAGLRQYQRHKFETALQLSVQTADSSTSQGHPLFSEDTGHSIEYPININQATIEELESLPGIGVVRAQAIISYRSKHGSFKSVEGLTQVRGIGKKTLAGLKELVTTQSEAGSKEEN